MRIRKIASGMRFVVAMALAKATRGVAEYLRSIDGAGWRRDPAARDAGVEGLVRRRPVVPHGDRVDRAESGGIEHEVVGVVANDHVVREFVLHDHLEQLGRRALRERPREDVLERA